MTTLNDMVTLVQRRVLSDLREESDQLSANINNSVTSFSLVSGQTLGSIEPGAYVQIDYELMKVMATSGSNTLSNVIRGYGGSVAASHTANAEVFVNPRFPAVDIIKAINEDIDDLSSPSNGLYQMLELTATFIPVRQGYDMTGVTPATVLEIFQVRTHEYGPSEKWPTIPGRMVDVQRNADTSTFPSGMSFTLDQGGYAGRPLRVQYKATFTTPLVNATDDVLSVTGLHTQAHDIPTLGAAARLMKFRELKRSFTEDQGEPRRAQEVPVGSSLTAVKGIDTLRDKRIAMERSRLNQQFPRQLR